MTRPPVIDPVLVAHCAERLNLAPGDWREDMEATEVVEIILRAAEEKRNAAPR